MRKINKRVLTQLIAVLLPNDTHTFINVQNGVTFYYDESRFIINNYFIVQEIINTKEITTIASKLMTKLFYIENKELIEEVFRTEG